MDSVNDQTLESIRTTVNNNLDLLSYKRGRATDFVSNSFSNIPRAFKLPFICIDSANKAYERNPVAKFLGSVVTGTIGLAVSTVVAAANLVAGIVATPFSLLLDGVPCLLSKKYRQKTKLARDARKLDKIADRIYHPKWLDRRFNNTTFPKLHNALSKSTPFSSEKAEKLVDSVSDLNSSLGRTEKNQNYTVEKYKHRYTDRVVSQRIFTVSNPTKDHNNERTL